MNRTDAIQKITEALAKSGSLSALSAVAVSDLADLLAKTSSESYDSGWHTGYTDLADQYSED